MPVGILVVTHGNLGREMIATARSTLGGTLPLASKVLSVSQDCDPDKLTEKGLEYARALDSGDGVIVLTDMFGSTPSNIANRLAQQQNVRVLSGINLPMLIRIYNYAKDPLDTLIEKAVSGGRDGCMLCQQPADHNLCSSKK